MTRISLILLLTVIMTPHNTHSMQEAIWVGTGTCMCSAALLSTVACCMKYRECQQSRATQATAPRSASIQTLYPSSQRKSSDDTCASYEIQQPNNTETSRNSQCNEEKSRG